MDLGRIINMAVNIVMRRVLNAGISKGMNHFAGKGKSDAPMTPEDKEQAAKGRDMTKRARQAAQVTRKIGR
jgi:hypothetical protein